MLPEVPPAVGELRELTRADVPELQALLERAADYFAVHEGRPPAPTEAEDDWDGVPDGTPRGHKQLFGLFAPGLVAVAEVVRDWPRPQTWIIGLLLLEPAIRRRGAGAAIVAGIDTWAARSGAERLRVAVKLVNPGGLAYWERLGYERVPVDATETVAHERPVTA